MNRGLNEEFFDISVENIGDDTIAFHQESISCSVSSQIVPTGYKVFGILNLPFTLQCDRCLDHYPKDVSLQYELWLTPDKNVVDDETTDAVWFPDSMEEIDLHSVMHDFILLEVPVKKVCRDDCLGLCSSCGTNLNHATCSCDSQSGDPRWDALKKISN